MGKKENSASHGGKKAACKCRGKLKAIPGLLPEKSRIGAGAAKTKDGADLGTEGRCTSRREKGTGAGITVAMGDGIHKKKAWTRRALERRDT